jgi:hypothetical protein
MVFTGSEKRSNLKKIQPGNRDWVTIIQGICAAGWAIPPFIIFSGKVLISNRYPGLPREWIIETSDNGWTTNELGVRWLKHFDAHTKDKTVGVYRLLIVDGYKSHTSHEFHKYCEEHKIITLCMPPYLSHLLQPLDVGCFALLKRAYYTELDSWTRCAITQIKKETFLSAFHIAFNKAITTENILAGFRGAGLVPHDPERVLSKLDVVLRTPTPLPPEATLWESKMSATLKEIEAQSTLIRNRIRQHRESPIPPLLQAVDLLAKGAAVLGHNSVLQAREMAGIRKAIAALTEQRSRKRRYIRTEETLTVGDVQNLIAEKDGGGEEAAEQPAKRVRKQRHCGRCGKTGHNARTCAAEIVDPDGSDVSE